jgi:hypothetical protein
MRRGTTGSIGAFSIPIAALVASAFALPGASFAAPASQKGADPVCSAKYLKQAAKVGPFIFKAYRDIEHGGACLLVLRDGKVIFRRGLEAIGEYTLGQPADPQSNAQKIENGTDITGRGRPDMIVAFYTGGMHCCRLHYVFELEPKFELLATLDSEHFDSAHFADLDGNGQYYLLSADWTFAYWPDCFACSPSAPVTLRFVPEGKGGSYHLALDEMWRPAPTKADWKTQIDEARGAFAESPVEAYIGTTLWNSVLNLIYSGHSDLAWKFLDEAWPPETPGKEKWLGDFCSMLKRSPYWPDVEPSITNLPQVCVDAKPGRLRF